MNGTIKNVHPEKGFGFIKGEDGKEYFFHYKALLNAEMEHLVRDQPVEFIPGDGPKGPRAENVLA